MSGVSNLRQVVSTTQAVERVQEAQNRSRKPDSSTFAESLEREAKDTTAKVKKNPDAKRADEREDHEARDDEEHASAGGGDEEREGEIDDENEDGEHHVDVIA